MTEHSMRLQGRIATSIAITPLHIISAAFSASDPNSDRDAARDFRRTWSGFGYLEDDNPHVEPLVVDEEALTSAMTTSTTFLKPSISSSTVPPSPALAKLIELPT